MENRLHNSHQVTSGQWVELSDARQLGVFDYLMWYSEDFVATGQLNTSYNNPGFIAIEPNKGGESTYFDIKLWYTGKAKIYGFTPDLPDL